MNESEFRGTKTFAFPEPLGTPVYRANIMCQNTVRSCITTHRPVVEGTSSKTSGGRGAQSGASAQAAVNPPPSSAPMSADKRLFIYKNEAGSEGKVRMPLL